MAEDSRPPSEGTSELPRRVPGAGGLTPGQVRRGFLPARTAGAPASSLPPDEAPAEPPRPPSSSSLPRRSPGA